MNQAFLGRRKSIEQTGGVAAVAAAARCSDNLRFGAPTARC